MTLDLDELTAGWDCPPGELRARLIPGRDGAELLQLRIDLGVMQMALTGRPDGERCHGLPSARAYIEHELRVRGSGSSENDETALTADDWAELERELGQTNYRRIAYSAAAEDALEAGDEVLARRFLAGALADMDESLAVLRLLKSAPTLTASYPTLGPTLVFDRARLTAQLRIVEGRFEEAIEHAEAGADALTELLAGLGYDEEQREEDAGLRYLRDLGLQLRREYGIAQTLAEQIAEAVANDDFETAARLRDELQRRTKNVGESRSPDCS